MKTIDYFENSANRWYITLNFLFSVNYIFSFNTFTSLTKLSLEINYGWLIVACLISDSKFFGQGWNENELSIKIGTTCYRRLQGWKLRKYWLPPETEAIFDRDQNYVLLGEIPSNQITSQSVAKVNSASLFLKWKFNKYYIIKVFNKCSVISKWNLNFLKQDWKMIL